MKSIILCFLLWLAMFSNLSMAEERSSREDAIALVQKVAAYMKKNGLEETIEEVNKVHGIFRNRDLYVTINDLHAKTLAHGANPKMQGKDLIDLQDSDGKYFMRERLTLANKYGKGWQDYKFVNPETEKIELKSMYFEKHDDVIINCGVYRQ